MAQVDRVFEWAATSRFASSIQTLLNNNKLNGLNNERLLLQLIMVLFPDRIFYRNLDMSDKAAATNLQWLAQRYLTADADDTANIESQINLLINK